MRTTHIGKILLSGKELLDLVGFPGGHIHYLGQEPDRIGYTMVVRHPDMPEVKEGELIPIVLPTYQFPDWVRVEPKPNFRLRLCFAIRILAGKF